jgi:hypothetical protein
MCQTDADPVAQRIAFHAHSAGRNRLAGNQPSLSDLSSLHASPRLDAGERIRSFHLFDLAGPPGLAEPRIESNRLICSRPITGKSLLRPEGRDPGQALRFYKLIKADIRLLGRQFHGQKHPEEEGGPDVPLQVGGGPPSFHIEDCGSALRLFENGAILAAGLSKEGGLDVAKDLQDGFPLPGRRTDLDMRDDHPFVYCMAHANPRGKTSDTKFLIHYQIVTIIWNEEGQNGLTPRG